MHFPANALPGNFHYEVTARYCQGSNMVDGPKATLAVQLAPQAGGNFELGLTRAYVSSQAYAAKFGNKPIRPLPKSLDYNTQPFQPQYEWLGYHAPVARYAEPINEIRACRFRAPSLDVRVEGRKNALQGAVMARQHGDFQIPKSIVGAALFGLGFFILLRNLDGVSELARFIRITGGEADSLGLLPAASIMIQKALQAYVFNHTEFLRALNQLLQSLSALLLMIVGTISFAGVFTAKAKESKKKNEDMSISQPLVRRLIRRRDFRQWGQLRGFVVNVGQGEGTDFPPELQPKSVRA